MAYTLVKGAELEVGLNGHTYAGVVTENATVENIGNVDFIDGEDAEPGSAYIYGKGKRISLSGMLTASNAASAEIGDEISINSIQGIVEKFDVAYDNKIAKVNITIVSHDSLYGA